MTYALIEKGEVKKYPYSFAALRRDNPDVSYPRDPTDEILAEHGVVPVAASAPPAVDDTLNVVETRPVLVNSIWTQAWSVVDADPADVAARKRNSADDAASAEVKADAFVKSYVAMTPAEISDYVNANITNIASAKVVIAKLAQMVLVLARREFRN